MEHLFTEHMLHLSDVKQMYSQPRHHSHKSIFCIQRPVYNNARSNKHKNQAKLNLRNWSLPSVWSSCLWSPWGRAWTGASSRTRWRGPWCREPCSCSPSRPLRMKKVIHFDVLFKKDGPFPAYFLYFHLLFCTISWIFLPMSGFEPRISGVGSNLSTNWATTTALISMYF